MGKRDVGQNFFIEPTTGVSHPLNWEHYHGIEVLWNHKNYWVNMQDCSQGVQVCSWSLKFISPIHCVVFMIPFSTRAPKRGGGGGSFLVSHTLNHTHFHSKGFFFFRTIEEPL